MDILELEIENFLAIKSAKLNLANKGLVLIRGENKDETSADSNGAGKSSIVDALSYVITGETARGDSGDSVINDTAGKNCYVGVTLIDDTVVYKAIRTRKHATWGTGIALMQCDRADYEVNPTTSLWTNITKGTDKETQALLTKIIGHSKDIFTTAIYAGQEAMPDLPKMTDKELKTLIESACGMTSLSKAYAKATANLLSLGTKKTTLELGLDRVKTSKANTWALLKAAATSYKNYEAVEKATKLATLSAQYKTLSEDQARWTKELSKYNLTKLNNDLTKAQEDLKEFKKFDLEENVLRSAVSKIENDLNNAQSAARTAMSFLKTLRDAYDNAEEELLKPCGECGKPHTPEEIDDWKAHQKKRIGEQVKACKLLGQTVAILQLTRDQESAKLKAFVKPDVSALSAQIALIQNQLREAGLLEGNINNGAVNLKNCQAQIEALDKAPNPHTKTMTECKALYDKYGKEVSDLEKQIQEVEKEIEVAKHVKEVFGPSGARAHILDSVTPFLNDRTAEYLSTLSDGSISATWSTLSKTAKGELREKFGIDVSSSTGAKNFRGLSGGEKRKVRLAAMLALQELVSSRAEKPLSLFIADEIDDSLDSAGLERLMTVLEVKAREKGTVLIISHNDLSDMCDSVTTVTKEGGFSTITGALTV